MSGPLQGFRIIEMAAIGPVPFCGMMLSDMGADMVRIDRKGSPVMHPDNPVNRGRRSIALDLKQPNDIDTALQLISQADALIEGFRPGVMERLGLGPTPCMDQNPRLVYGRMTGWGQTGPLAQAAGHDINYIALTGALHAMSRDGQPPSPPLNLIGDYGGGAMLLATGVLAALLESSRSGMGQVIDAAMTDGSAILMSLFHGLQADGSWRAEPGTNMLDGGAHFYNSYTCADGKFISIGPIEPQFYAALLQRCEIDDPAFQAQMDTAQWPALKQKLTALFKTRSRDEWCALLEGSDVCFAPVLDTHEAARHPHNKARQTFVTRDSITQAAPAPRFSRTPATIKGPPPAPDQQRNAILRDWLSDTN
ncbi:MAG: CaiB/BaiF CoA-transferase family protein [Pseudohongiella sp.]|uniref:CaiB/BaiF CoA transferase family protein n=1 Tax=Pseudohongiella sp. TaxID=1979412 RepID=UPI0034A02F86